MQQSAILPAVLALGLEPTASAMSDARVDTAPPVTDEALMGRVATGDSDAFAELVRRHERWARTYAGRILHDFIEAEDIVQDAFIKVWTTAPAWKPKASFRHWFTVILTRRCIDFQRKKRPEPVEEVPEGRDPGPSAFDVVAREEREGIVAELIGALPDAQRIAVMLVHGEGRKTADAAEAMEMHMKAFESLLLRARKALRARFLVRTGERP